MPSACVPKTVDRCGGAKRKFINQSRSAGVAGIVRSVGRLRKRIRLRATEGCPPQSNYVETDSEPFRAPRSWP